MVIDHSLPNNSEYNKGLQEAKFLWDKYYPHEPFEVNLDDINFMAPLTEYKQQSQYNLELAISRQKAFFYQVSLPHYSDRLYLSVAVKRYRKLLHLKRLNPDAFLVPCYDFDLVWHTHQLHPAAYAADCMALLDKIFNHDDTVNDRSPDSKLTQSDQMTRQLWRDTFSEDFSRNGAMYRGQPPFGKLHYVSSETVFDVSSKMAGVTINTLSVSNLAVDKPIKYQLKVAVNGMTSKREKTVLTLKGSQLDTPSQNSNALTTFLFDTQKHSELHFRLEEQRGLWCFGSKSSTDQVCPMRAIVEATPSTGQIVSRSLSLDDSSPENTDDPLAVNFTASVEPPQKGPCCLNLTQGTFESCTMPENVEQLWGPVPLSTLPPNVNNTCVVASHR